MMQTARCRFSYPPLGRRSSPYHSSIMSLRSKSAEEGCTLLDFGIYSPIMLGVYYKYCSAPLHRWTIKPSSTSSGYEFRLDAYPDGFLRKDSYPFVVFIGSVEIPVKILCVTLQISTNFDLYDSPTQSTFLFSYGSIDYNVEDIF